jgi:hypothetical protein
MSAYVCTYRHPSVEALAREWALTEPIAVEDPLLRDFLAGYEESFWDWGDDPAFFSAARRLGDERRASWGVCRPDVRASLDLGSLVVFFCARQEGLFWHYYFIGFGKVAALVERARLWIDPDYEEYNRFYNILARLEDGRLVQAETFYDYHINWEHRAAAPYVIFDPDHSHFNLRNPHWVAAWQKGERVPEVWRADERSQRIAQLLFTERGIERRLRTSHRGNAHARLNLITSRGTPRSGRDLPEFAKALSELVL